MSTPPTHSYGSYASNSSSGQLPVVLGRKPQDVKLESKGGEEKRGREDVRRMSTKKRGLDSKPTLNFKTAAEELVFGQVYIALHLTRGIDHANVRTKDSFYIVGNRNHILSLNAVWLEKEQLTTLCKDVKRLGAKLHLFEAEPYALCKKEKYIPLCMFAITCLLTIGATASSILNWEDGKACLMIAAGLVFSLTVMCCFCLNFRRRKILDWEVPLTELDHFAREWSSKHGLKLRFEFNRVGPSYFVLKPPLRLEEYQNRIDDKESSEEDFEEDPLSPTAPQQPPKAEVWRPRVMGEPPV